ncbi:MAG: hypothetical protein Q7T74_03660 [Candidatus Saccharibacteria bacterium]|nr:hypothetical protein [Candidatus Saccharibacteria bacterium]
MSDLDFDELDKAVNSLVGDDSSKDEKVEKPEDPKVDEQVEKADSSAAPNLPSRRAGRFMDMKHDNSIMKKDTSPTLMTSNTTNIKPLNLDTKPDSNQNEPDKNKIDSDDDKKQTSSFDNTTMPIDDELQKKDDDNGESKRDEKVDDDNKKASPFIDDAKVEKRPLGGPAADEDDIDKKDKEADIKDGDDGETTGDEAPEPEPIELPPELDKELVAIEADEAPESPVNSAEQTEQVEPKTEQEENDKEKTSERDEVKKDGTNKDHKEEVAQLLASAASGSIPDQYKREQRSHELHAPHPLFDAEHFKDAPAATHKKPKSTGAKIFQWIFISLGLLLLGASIGAAVFVLVSKG